MIVQEQVARPPDGGRDLDGQGAARLLAGVAILAVLVALAIIVAAGRSGVVSGHPVATPVPEPPVEGDCLLEDPHARGANTYGPSVPLQYLRTGSCSGARFGEVASAGAGVGTDPAAIDQSWQQCWSAAYTYLGLPDPAAPAHLPMADVRPILIGPNERQRAAGQDWSACVVHPPPARAGAENAGMVDHSLRGAWDRPVQARLFAMCQIDATLMRGVASCWLPHRFEQVSIWPGDPATAGQHDLDGCRADAIGFLGGPAALERGELAVLVEYFGWDEASGTEINGPEVVTATGEYVVDCLLTPADDARRLTGPLRGLGDAPAPLG